MRLRVLSMTGTPTLSRHAAPPQATDDEQRNQNRRQREQDGPLVPSPETRRVHSSRTVAGDAPYGHAAGAVVEHVDRVANARNAAGSAKAHGREARRGIHDAVGSETDDGTSRVIGDQDVAAPVDGDPHRLQQPGSARGDGSRAIRKDAPDAT